MSDRFETPLLVDVKIEELKIWGGGDIKVISFVKRKPKMHHYKIHDPVTISSSEQFVNLTPILTHRCFHKGSSQRFSSKKTCQISNLNKPLIAGNHVYLNCSAFLALQTDWWVQDMRPHCSSIWKYRNWKFGTKKYKICIFGITQTQNAG